MAGPITYTHGNRHDKAVTDDGSGIDEQWSTYDGTPEARYDTWWEIGDQRANVASPLNPLAPVGMSGNQPQTVGTPVQDTPAHGYMPAAIFNIDLRNAGVFAPPAASGQVQIQNPSFWYDGGAMEPLWQQSNNTSPFPEAWDASLTVGLGAPLQTLPASGS